MDKEWQSQKRKLLRIGKKQEAPKPIEEAVSSWEAAPGTGIRNFRGQHVFVNCGWKRRELLHD